MPYVIHVPPLGYVTALRDPGRADKHTTYGPKKKAKRFKTRELALKAAGERLPVDIQRVQK